MTTDAVVVAGVGMMTAVGLSAGETVASVRASMMRFTESDFRDHRFERFVVAEVLDAALPELAAELMAEGLTSREMRLLRLGGLPLREAAMTLASRGERPGLILALPELPTTRPLDHAAFLQRFAVQTGHAFDLQRSTATHGGRAGGLVAIGHAIQLIRSGYASVLLAGGIDSYRDLYVLGTLDRERRIKSTAAMDGFIPGEGAAFVLLASQEAAASRGLTPLATVSPVAQGFESGHLYSEAPYRGDGLAATLAQLIGAGVIGAPVAEVYSSMNGESHWAKEWGVAYLRNRDAFVSDHGMHHPADCLGDTGAASGPLMVGLASIGIRGGSRQSPCLVYSSSDTGARAALAVSAA
jgi:3-oxoacyl-[acyl-carrier-protein] synthase-1